MLFINNRLIANQAAAIFFFGRFFLAFQRKLRFILAFFTLVLLGVVLPCSASYAQVSVSSLSDMDFGAIDFAGAYSGSIRLGTNGDVTVTGFGLVVANSGSAGSIRIDTPDTGIVEVKCTTTGEMVGAGATSLTISSVEIAMNSGAAFGGASLCQGIGAGDSSAIDVDMDSFPDAIILIGGEISIPGAITLPSDRHYNTTGSGSPISLSLVVQ